MSSLKAKLKKTDGFIAIIALGIFAMLTVFGIMVQQTTINTVNSIKNSNNYYAARDTAESVIEHLQFEINQKEAGYNMETLDCAYGDFTVAVTDPDFIANDLICDGIVYPLGMLDENIKITMEIKGRSVEEEKFQETIPGDCPGIMGGECYIVPFPGTGDAGDRCDLYESYFGNESAAKKIDHNGQITEIATGPEGTDWIKQIDYSCNWNKLSFGSSSTDRATIPFYFDTGTDIDPIKNPFNTAEEGDPATSFALRVRTPCLPCVYESEQLSTGINRLCEQGDDPTICIDDDRYELDDGSMNFDAENDIVVQWQLTGTCDEGGTEVECGLIQNIDFVDLMNSSAITESRINYSDGLWPNHIVLPMSSSGIDTSTYSINLTTIQEKLSTFQKPILSLLLIEKLISTRGKNVPYLEYQVLTDKPIANPKIKAEVTVNVDGNIFKKILYKEEEKSLIDFAIQN